MKKAAGFTLIELLLVLVLIGIGTGLAIVAVDRLAGRTEERRWLDRTEQELRRLRNKAVLGGVPVEAALDFGYGTITVLEKSVLELPKNYRFRPAAELSSAETSLSSDRLALIFYPDGTLQEASFAMVTPKGLRQEYHLEKVSGRITSFHVSATP